MASPIELARRMDRALKENRLAREIKNLTRPTLVIIDEVGSVFLLGRPLGNTGTELIVAWQLTPDFRMVHQWSET